MTSARRHPRLRSLAAVLGCGAVVALGTWWEAARAPAEAASDAAGTTVRAAQADEDDETRTAAGGRLGDPEAGRALYLEGCASCHARDGTGVDGKGPTLENAGAASADFYLTSGRMPASTGEGDQPLRKPPAYSPDEIADLVAYVATLGEGPEIPELDVEGADLPLGQQLYTANCAGCHNAAGSGGALGQGSYAPAVTRADALQVAQAARIGPGGMPEFGEGVLDDEQLAAVVRYVDHLRNPPDPGGFALGRIGPVTEGMVAWLVGMVLLLVAARVIGTRE